MPSYHDGIDSGCFPRFSVGDFVIAIPIFFDRHEIRKMPTKAGGEEKVENSLVTVRVVKSVEDLHHIGRGIAINDLKVSREFLHPEKETMDWARYFFSAKQRPQRNPGTLS